MAAEGFADAVVVDRVHKWYRLYASPSERLKRVLVGSSRHLDFRALEDVSFTVPPSAALGVIGENGAGKSTLLKLIAGTTRPTAGRVAVTGNVAAILELGAAFHPEFSGRDNAVLYGAMMGLDRAQMLDRLERVVAFAELGSFIDNPIKSYSTGMTMRLAFAVATHVEPEVLVVDEALAVGDGYFQKKCVDAILAIKERGTTILFCSHSMHLVSTFCDRVLWLKNGRAERLGPAAEVVNAYEEYLVTREKRRLEADGEGGSLAGETPAPGRKARIRGLRALPGAAGEPPRLRPGEDLTVEIDWEIVDPGLAVHVGCSLDRGDGSRLLGVATFLEGRPALKGAGEHTTRVIFRAVPVAQGAYAVTGYLFDESGLHIWDQAIASEKVEAVVDGWAPALLDVPHDWSFVR